MKISEKIDILREETFAMFPDAVTELEYENDFQLLIAILMSAQTTDMQVNKANKEFFKVLKTPEDWRNLGIEKIQDYIKTIWFYKNKAKNIYTTCNMLIDTYHSIPPKTLTELTQLAGVGIKTAKVFLAVTQDAPYLAVDTHVHRVLNRVWIVNTKTPEETDKRAEKIFTHHKLGTLHNTLIFFGRYHCIARKPKCDTCPITNICRYYKQKKSA